MGLSRRLLADGEEVVYEARPHWLVLSGPAVVLLAVAAALVAVAVAVPGAPVAVAEGLAALGGLAALWLAARALRWRRTIVAVTTLRVIERSGVLSRRGEEIRLDRIAELTYHQSLLGMLCGAGRLAIDTGAGGVAVLDDVQRPARLQSVITDQITAYQRSLAVPAGGWAAPAWAGGDAAPAASGWATPPAGTPATGASSGSVADRLATLSDLHLRGLVSDQEYAAKRAQLLDQL